jgi:hypothetical protein
VTDASNVELTPFGLSGGSWHPLIVWAADETRALAFAEEWLDFVERAPFHRDAARVRVLGEPRSRDELEAVWAEIETPAAYDAALEAGERFGEILGLDGWRGAFAIREGSRPFARPVR